MITIQRKGQALPKACVGIKRGPREKFWRDPLEGEEYPERGILYEQDPDKLEAMMAEADRKREEAHKAQGPWRRIK